MEQRRIVTLLTDFGQRDPFVGIMKGVILGRCPTASIVDLCHDLRPYDIAGASFVLRSAMPFFPSGTIHVVVVDPGVGGARRPLAAQVGGQLLVAPDNGVLTYPLDTDRQAVIRVITASEYFLHPVSATFHGRDVFAPVAGHLAAGLAPERLGPLLADPRRLAIPQAQVSAQGTVSGVILWVDRFGNCVTNIRPGEVEGRDRGGRILLNGRPFGRLVGYFDEAGPAGCGALVGSTGYLELFCNQEDCAERWGLTPGATVVLDIAGGGPSSDRGVG